MAKLDMFCFYQLLRYEDSEESVRAGLPKHQTTGYVQLPGSQERCMRGSMLEGPTNMDSPEMPVSSCFAHLNIHVWFLGICGLFCTRDSCHSDKCLHLPTMDLAESVHSGHGRGRLTVEINVKPYMKPCLKVIRSFFPVSMSRLHLKVLALRLQDFHLRENNTQFIRTQRKSGRLKQLKQYCSEMFRISEQGSWLQMNLKWEGTP